MAIFFYTESKKILEFSIHNVNKKGYYSLENIFIHFFFVNLSIDKVLLKLYFCSDAYFKYFSLYRPGFRQYDNSDYYCHCTGWYSNY